MILDWTYSTNLPKNTKYTWLLLMETTDGETAIGVYDDCTNAKEQSKYVKHCQSTDGNMISNA